MLNVTIKELDDLTRTAWIQGVCAALAYIAHDNDQPTMAAGGLKLFINPLQFQRVEINDRNRLKKASEEAWFKTENGE